MGVFNEWNKIITEIGLAIDNSMTVGEGVTYYRLKLFEKCVRIFEWTGLPFPQKELEFCLLSSGFAGVVDDEKAGVFVTRGSMSGVTVYPDEFKQFTYANPEAKGGTVKINSDNCIIIDNDSMRSGIIPLVNRYAVLMAHADSTLKDTLINMRYDLVFSTDDDATTQNIKLWRKEVVNGRFAPILDKSLIDKAIALPTSSQGKGQLAKDSLEVRENLLRDFLTEIGIRSVKDKRGNMIDAEVRDNDMMLLFNISDMLKYRKEGARKLSRFIGSDVSVDLSPEFKALTENDTSDATEVVESEGENDDDN